MKKVLWFLVLLTSCASTSKEIPIQQTSSITYGTSSQPEVFDGEEEQEQQEITISLATKNIHFIQLLKDIVSRETKAPLEQKQNLIQTKVKNKQAFAANIENRLDRYGIVKKQNEKIVIAPNKLPLNENYVLISFQDKISDKGYQSYDTILSTARRQKWRIIAEWESPIALAVWTKDTAKNIAKSFRKKLQNFNIDHRQHTIILEEKQTTLLFSLDDGDLWREIKASLKTRFDDMGITYKEKERTMNIAKGTWEGSITSLVRKILKEDLFLPSISLKLDKTTKTITIVKKSDGKK